MADLLIATPADAHDVTPIHCDADFEIAAEVLSVPASMGSETGHHLSHSFKYVAPQSNMQQSTGKSSYSIPSYSTGLTGLSRLSWVDIVCHGWVAWARITASAVKHYPAGVPPMGSWPVSQGRLAAAKAPVRRGAHRWRS